MNQIPAVRYAVPFIVGIGLANWTKYDHELIWLALVSAVALGFVYHFLCAGDKFKYKAVVGFFYTIGLIALGWKSYMHQNDTDDLNHFSNFSRETHVWKVDDTPVKKGQTFRCVLICLSNTNGKRRSGRIQAYWQGDSSSLNYGDVVIFKQAIDTIRGPLNEEEFDYGRYMHIQHIYHQVFLKDSSWVKLPWKCKNPILKFAYNLRVVCQKTLQDGFPREKAALLQAIILGRKELISSETKEAFGHTGTMHILAVSGLHVGIVYLFLQFVFGFLKKDKWKRLVKGLLILVALFLFASVTGFSPSTCRASLMFGIISIGHAIDRKGNTVNSLAFSALLLLIWDPNNLFKLGFQFSYIAVLGIVLLQPTIRGFFATSDWFLDKVYSLMAVSIAAQLVTAPLGLFYFGQFSFVFLLSNVLIVPIVSIILYLGLAYLMLFWVPWVGEGFALLLEAYVWFVQYAIDVLQQIPSAYVDSIHISTFEFFILTAAVLVMIAHMLHRNGKWFLLISGYLLVGFLFLRVHRSYDARLNKHVIYFRTDYHGVLTCIQGDSVLVLSGNQFTKRDWDYHCRPLISRLGITDPKTRHERLYADKALFRVTWEEDVLVFGHIEAINNTNSFPDASRITFYSYQIQKGIKKRISAQPKGNITIVNEFHKRLK